MILLDTNVVSEAMKAAPATEVMAWLRARPLQDLAISAVTLAEIRYGLARLPEGRRRLALEQRFRLFVVRGFGERLLDFDRAAANLYGDIVVAREKAGRPIEAFDAMIAATARSRGASIATRDVGGFDKGHNLLSYARASIFPNAGSE